MITSLGLILLFGIAMGDLCKKIGLPGLVGMLVTGIILGPYVLNLLDPTILAISSDLRKIALIIILLKAGLSLDLEDLKKVGRPAILLSFLPASFEILAYLLFAPKIFGISKVEALLMGSVLSAVSPAVVVPRMVNLIEKRYGTDKAIPQMILAGSSMDDIFVIVLFTSFLSMAQGASLNYRDFLNIPLSIILGIILGGVVGYFLNIFFERAYKKDSHVRNSMKVLILLALSFLLVGLEDLLKDRIAISSLLAIVSMAATLRLKSTSFVTNRLGEKFGKVWLGAEVMLFVLVGSAVDIRYSLKAGLPALLMIFIALIIRSIGVILATYKTNLSFKERIFCVISYLPKATVQAAIGSVPLSLGLPCGNLILSLAVMAILVTAPLGAYSMDKTYKKLLSQDQ